MRSQVINHKLHSLYTYAIVQLGFDDKAKFEAAFKYMENAYGAGICHDRHKITPRGYSRNTGDNRVWYYSDTTTTGYGYRRSEDIYKLYLTTPEQMTMVSLFFN